MWRCREINGIKGESKPQPTVSGETGLLDSSGVELLKVKVKPLEE
jgi:hypothetical protein